MKRVFSLAFLLLFCVSLASAQTPDCQSQKFTFTATGQTSTEINNNGTNCHNWFFWYQSTGFSALNVTVQSADGVSSAGTYGNYSGTVSVGINPNTSTTGAYTSMSGTVAFIRVKLTSSTGTGTVTGVLQGYRSGYSIASASLQAYQTIQDEGVSLAQRSTLNVTGAGVTCIDSGGKTVCDIPGGVSSAYQTIDDEGTPLTQRTTLDFAGAGVSCADSGGTKTLCTIPGGIASAYQTVDDEGTPLTQRSTIDFAGAGVGCADSGGTQTLCTIPATVSSVQIVGTSNEVAVAGTCTITAAGVCTLSLPVISKNLSVLNAPFPDSSGNVIPTPLNLVPSIGGSTFFAYQTFLFTDTATLDCLHFNHRVPDDLQTGSASTYTVWWSTTATDNTKNGIWTVDYRDVPSGSTVAATTSTRNLTVTTASPSTASLLTPSILTATTPDFTPGDFVQVKLCRNGAGADTIAAGLVLQDVVYNYSGKP